MPRDDSFIRQYDPSDPFGKGPLRRGDACLYCRKRRIKCTAEKPSCQNCNKLKRECIYDSGKPVSRVKQLEEKVAELEDMLKVGPVAGGGQRSTSSAEASRSGSISNGAPGAPPLAQSSTGSTPNLSAAGMNAFPFHQHQQNGGYPMDNAQAGPSSMATPFGDTFRYQFETFKPALHTTLPPGAYDFPDQGMSTFGTSRVDQSAVNMFDFTTLDPGYMNLVNTFGATSTGPEETQFISQPMQQAPQPRSTQQPQHPQHSQMQHPPHALPTQHAHLVQSAQSASYNVDMEMEYTQSTGFTPYMNTSNDQTQPNLPVQTPSQFVSSNSISPPSNTPPTTVPRAISIQPPRQEERVSYHAYVSVVPESTPPAEPAPPTSSSEQQTYPKEYKDWLDSSMYTSQANPLSCSNGLGMTTGTDAASGAVPSQKTGVFDTGFRSWTQDPPGAEEAKTLVGGWFDPTDLPRVARDHL